MTAHTHLDSIYSVERSDVARWKPGYITTLPPYFIVLVSSVKTKEVEVIEFHRIGDDISIYSS